MNLKKKMLVLIIVHKILFYNAKALLNYIFGYERSILSFVVLKGDFAGFSTQIKGYTGVAVVLP